MAGTDTDDRVPSRPVKGRGSVTNRSGRYEPAAREQVDDGWGTVEEELPPLRTTVGRDRARKAITSNDSPDVGFDQSINPYRGCEHGCAYCFARPTHAWLGLSAGLDFETKLFAKHDAAALLEAELRAPSHRCKVIALGVNTDAYQPIERDLKITRGILEVLSRFEHPVALITKSTLVTRDIDILADMAARRLVHVTLSVTTLDRHLARRLEPRAATPARRIDAVRALAAAGIPTSVNVAPMIPGLNDHELESVLAAAAGAGASKAGYILLRLPLEIRDLFREWLETHVPDRAARVLSLVRQTRGGALYKDRFGERMRGEGPIADLIERRFRIACARLGLDKRDYVLDTSRFRRPPAPGDQIALPF